MTMQSAEFHRKISEGPAGGSAYWVETEDHLRIRVGVWNSKKKKCKGTVLVFTGRFGYVERFGRVAKALDTNGFAVATLDWRSQGLSERIASDPQVGHVRSFGDYQKDVAAFIRTATELNLPEPWFLMGISMGACIGLRALDEGLPVKAASFISPMWGINLSPIKRAAAWPLSSLATLLGRGASYVPGDSGTIYVLNTPFDQNNLTNDEEMYAYWKAQAEAHPELHIGGPSMSWLYNGLLECRKLTRLPSPEIPCMTICGENDALVDNDSTVDRMNKWPGGVLRIAENAKHDPLTERKDGKYPVVDEVCTFFASS